MADLKADKVAYSRLYFVSYLSEMSNRPTIHFYLVLYLCSDLAMLLHLTNCLFITIILYIGSLSRCL